MDNVEPQEDNECFRYSSNHGHPYSIASLSPLHKPKSLALPTSLAQRPLSKLDNSTSNQYNAYNFNQDDEKLTDIHPNTNGPIDSPPTLEQGTGSAIDDDRAMTNPNDFQNDMNQSFLDDFSPYERDGLSAVDMHNKLDKILGEMYSIQIQNAILMDTLVLMGSDM